MNAKMSLLSLFVCVLIILSTHFGYYPKWKMVGTEATISWDVSGYYMYLPAMFVYKDLKKCQFKDEIIKKYSPTPDFHQAFIHEKSGNYVMKYSIGQAVVFSPFFFIGHYWALNDASYKPDGFSFPYQFMISIGTLIIAIMGLIFLRKSMLVYFNDITVGLSLLGIVIGTNYLNYSAIDGAMTHNTLFLIYAVLTWLSIQFYRKPTLFRSIGIGVCIGLAALTRPTEIIAAIIPILWGVNLLSVENRNARLGFIKEKWSYIAVSIFVSIVIGCLQLFYWKYVSGDWIVYSYQDQGFSWLSPHIWKGLFSYRSGWLIYTPFMLIAVLGFIPLFRKRKNIFYTTFIFFLLFIYIAFAWDIWWYGGSLGQRTMVQAYPILAFPLCAMIERVFQKSWITKALTIIASVIFIYANLWFTHQAHKGGLLHPGHMTGSYFWKTLFTYEKKSENLKLLDNVDEVYEGKLINPKTIYNDTTFLSKLNHENQFSETIEVGINQSVSTYDMIRVSVNASIKEKEWNFWKMTQIIVEVKNQEVVIDSKMIRMQRHLSDHQTKNMFLDLRMPNQHFTTLEIKFWNADGDKPITLSNLSVDMYNEE